MSKEKKHINLPFPEGVSDKKAYIEYVSLQNDLEQDKNRYYQTSDPELLLDIAATTNILEKYMASSGLPMSEKNEIIGKSKIYRGLIQRIGFAKRRAFGKYSEVIEDGEFTPLTHKQAELIEYFGKFYTVKDVLGIVMNEWGYDVTLDDVRRFYKQNLSKIEEKRKEFERNIDSVRLGRKKSRLEELSSLYSSLKISFTRDGGDSVTKAKILKELLESIKREVEGDLVIDAKIRIDIQESVNTQVYKEMMKDFNITVLIISRMAAKIKVNPLYILSRLAGSHYAKFTGFAQPEISMMEDRIDYPSQVSYDMNHITEMYQNKEGEYLEKKALNEVKDTENMLNIREVLLQKLKNKQSLLSDSENIVTKNP